MATNQKTGFHLKVTHTEPVAPGTVVRLEALDSDRTSEAWVNGYEFTWKVIGPFSGDIQDGPPRHGDHAHQYDFDTSGRRPGAYTFTVTRTARTTPGGNGDNTDDTPQDTEAETRMAPLVPDAGGSRQTTVATTARAGRAADIAGPWIVYVAAPAASINEDGIVPVSLQRTAVTTTPDQLLWTLIRNRTNAIGFRAYKRFIDNVMCRGIDIRNPGSGADLTFTGSQAYDVLKQATNAYLMQESGVIDKDVTPQEYLEAETVLDSLQAQLGARDGARLAGEEARRMQRKSLTFDDLRRMRAAYFEQLGDEQAILLPYLRIIRDRLSDIPLKQPGEIVDNCYGILRSKVTGPPALELIWSYWMEEGMLVQTLNAILARFQNRKVTEGPDPLARLDLDPLRPLSNLFWGWAEDEMHRLTVRRRAYEYDHEYGLLLIGRAVPSPRTVDSRSKFLESFHTLLNLAHVFFKEDDDTTVIADGFPLLNGLRETHLVLAHGAHNQFGDMPSTARAEMLIMQWLLARPEMRDFLGGRVMVPYEEEWEDRVDSMKTMQGWSDVTVTHFRDMGVFGEQILLGIRYGNWSVINDPQQAANWARYWRPEIQRYVHAYRAATGVDLTARVDSSLPGRLLHERLGGSGSRHN